MRERKRDRREYTLHIVAIFVTQIKHATVFHGIIRAIAFNRTVTLEVNLYKKIKD